MGRIIGWIIFIPIVLFIGGFIILQNFFPMTMMSWFGYGAFLVANTRSMEPQLYHNDMIFVSRVDFNSLSVDDVVTFRTPATIDGRSTYVFISHAIIEVVYHPVTGERGFRTSGIADGVGVDAAVMTIDGAYGTNQFVGQVVGSSRFVGNIVAYLQSPFGLVTVLVIIICFFSIMWVLGWRREDFSWLVAEMKDDARTSLSKATTHLSTIDITNRDKAYPQLRQLELMVQETESKVRVYRENKADLDEDL